MVCDNRYGNGDCSTLGDFCLCALGMLNANAETARAIADSTAESIISYVGSKLPGILVSELAGIVVGTIGGAVVGMVKGY